MARDHWTAMAFRGGFEGVSWTGPARDGKDALERCRLAAATVYGPNAKGVTVNEAMPVADNGLLTWRLMPGALMAAMGSCHKWHDVEPPKPEAPRIPAQHCIEADARLIGAMGRGEIVVVKAMAELPSGKPVDSAEPLFVIGRCMGNDGRDSSEMVSDATMDRLMALSLKTIVQLALSGRNYMGDGRHNAYARIEMPESATLAALQRQSLIEGVAANAERASAHMRAIGAAHYA